MINECQCCVKVLCTSSHDSLFKVNCHFYGICLSILTLSGVDAKSHYALFVSDMIHLGYSMIEKIPDNRNVTETKQAAFVWSNVLNMGVSMRLM